MSDFNKEINERLSGMYNILESSDIYCDFISVNEGLLGKIKELRNNAKAKKEAKAERKRMEAEEKAEQKRLKAEADKERTLASLLTNNIVIPESLESKAEDMFEEVVEDLQRLFKKEIPGVFLENRKTSHNRTMLKDDHVFHKLSVSVFQMHDKNLKSFINNTRNRELDLLNKAQVAAKVARSVGRVGAAYNRLNGNDMVDTFDTETAISNFEKYNNEKIEELVKEDFRLRIEEGIIGLGFKRKGQKFVKDIEGLGSFTISIDSFYYKHLTRLTMKFVTKPENQKEDM